jgi:AcrR family transcriptional regulator
MEQAETTRGRILDAAEALMRRHGLAKTTVVDVARALGMSHANVYRHVASKAALQDAVAERWLHAVSAPLALVADGEGPAAERLVAWVEALVAAKRRKVLDDPELFATYHAVAEAAREVVGAHVAELRAQLGRIVRDGVERGEFAVSDPDAAAAAVLDATVRFHHPHHVAAAGSAGPAPGDEEVRRVLRLLLAGLKAGAI